MKPTVARSLARGRLGALLGFVRTRATALGYGLFAFVVFATALLWSLPHELIAARALDVATAGAPVRVGFRSVAIAFPDELKRRAKMP